MNAFIEAIAWHYHTFALDRQGHIWHMWFDLDGPNIECLIGTETEYYEPIRALRAIWSLHNT